MSEKRIFTWRFEATDLQHDELMAQALKLKMNPEEVENDY